LLRQMPGLSVEEFALDEARRALPSSLERFRESVERWTPFQTPSYLALWEKSFGARNRCRIVAGWDRRGELAAYAPLMRVRGRVGPVPVSTLRFIGNNIGYPGDILHVDVLATHEDRAAVRAVLGHVASTWSLGKWDLGYLPPSSPTPHAASEILRDGFVAPDRLASVPFVSLPLPVAWDEYFASLTANTRSSYRRGLRHLEAQGPVKVVVETTPDRARRRVEELIENHLRWLTGTEKEGWFAAGDVREFLVSSSGFLAAEGQFLTSALELDGTPVAWILGAADARTFYAQISSYDRTHAEGSPGLVLGLELVRELIARGYRRVDLGPGSTLYKSRLGGVEEPHLRTLGYQGWTRRAAWAQNVIRGRSDGRDSSSGGLGLHLCSNGARDKHSGLYSDILVGSEVSPKH